MEENYKSKYSGEQVDAAVEYFLRHTQNDSSDYLYITTIFCNASTTPLLPFLNTSLPTKLPDMPFIGVGNYTWYDVPGSESTTWYLCLLKINNANNTVMQQGSVIKITGDKGDKGLDGHNGQDGAPGENGTNGLDGDFTEFRYRRSSEYSLSLTLTLKQSRYPEGWSSDWNQTPDMLTWSALPTELNNTFNNWLGSFTNDFYSKTTTYFDELGDTPTFKLIHDRFLSFYPNLNIEIPTVLQASVIEAYKKLYSIYNEAISTTHNSTILKANTDYHQIITDYIDSSHIWVLFLINAIISPSGIIKRYWSEPQRIQGVDGKPGPKGSNGIDGIPGVNMGIAFCLGTETLYSGNSPLTYSYRGLTASGTGWYANMPLVTEENPYVWVTHCRYTKQGDVYTLEDAWSEPRRYTGKNGIQEVITTTIKNPIIYPAGVFTLGTTYVNDGNRAPYVYYDNGSSSNYYYLSSQTSFTSDTATYNPASASNVWTLLEGFEALYTKVGIIANGLIGSAVFNGDYMFSLQGVDYNNNVSTHYEGFLKDYNNGNTLSNPYDSRASFKPNFCINFKTGDFYSRSYQQEIDNLNNNITNKLSLFSSTIDGVVRRYEETTRNLDNIIATNLAHFTITADGLVSQISETKSTLEGLIQELDGKIKATASEFDVKYEEKVKEQDKLIETNLAQFNIIANGLNSTVSTYKQDTEGKVAELSSKIELTSSLIAMTVSETVEGKLKTGGIKITPLGAEVTGTFVGTSSGTFKGGVEAESFNVVDEAGSTIISMRRYESSMGLPSTGPAPEEGTPVICVYYKGKLYITNLTLLSSPSNSLFIELDACLTLVQMVTDVALTSTLRTATYYKLTSIPTAVEYVNSLPTGNVISATLYESDGVTPCSWSKVLGCIISNKTLPFTRMSNSNLSEGILNYKLNSKIGYTGTLYNSYKNKQALSIITNLLGDNNGNYAFFTLSLQIYGKETYENGILTNLNGYIIVGPKCTYSYDNSTVDRYVTVTLTNSLAYYVWDFTTYSTVVQAFIKLGRPGDTYSGGNFFLTARSYAAVVPPEIITQNELFTNNI